MSHSWISHHGISPARWVLRGSFVDAIISQRALWEVYYPPFQAALEAGHRGLVAVDTVIQKSMDVIAVLGP